VRIFRWAVIVWTVCITLLVGLAVSIKNPRPITETRTFCAYGRIFVEFEDNGRIWGTLMLDFYGKPIPCTEGTEPEISNTI
jgi:hypothetical protein